MNKTNPIGVRFRADLLEKLKSEFGVDSPQKALIFYERFFVSHGILLNDVTLPIRSSKDAPKEKSTAPAESKAAKKESIPEALSKKEVEAVLKQIEEVRSEKIPKERDTPNGRKAWDYDQNKRINELKKLLQ